MAIANHVIRRRAFYAWRRVWRGSAIQIPLSTTDATHARRLAAAATAAASVGWGLLDAGRITLHDAKQEIHRAVQNERLALDYEAAGGDPEHLQPGGRAFYFFFNLAAMVPTTSRIRARKRGNLPRMPPTPLNRPHVPSIQPHCHLTPRRTYRTPPMRPKRRHVPPFYRPPRLCLPPLPPSTLPWPHCRAQRPPVRGRTSCRKS